ncbi:hypothetical protein [Chitinibacter tainanensis]|uniref:hypothetical protein n=1 Tax=Chitinibacter tainanensis TaxID=230667 RepID=UPI002356FFBD|nr:hypothetical protein [Chitinibacter tainanensis]
MLPITPRRPLKLWPRLRPALLPALLVGLLSLALLWHGPIQQLPDYHHFADRRSWLGLPNAADVLSNLGFALVALWGGWRLSRANPAHPAWRAYALFFLALLLTAVGSGWYHLAPDNTRLVFDRIPIALACVALLAAVWQDQYGRTGHGGQQTLACLLLTLLAYLSVWWWQSTDVPLLAPAADALLAPTPAQPLGLGDLRPYLLLQILPLILIPLVQWQAGSPARQRRAFALAIALYIAAKAAELQDHQLFHQLQWLSGHTLKHLLASLAALVIGWQMPLAEPRQN